MIAPSLTRIAIAALAAVGLFVGGQQINAAPPADVPAALAALPVAEENPTGYDRARFGYGWADLDKDCFDTRAEVLIDQLDGEVLDGCRVVSGRFRDPYTGISGQADAGSLDIDHVVSLGDAWRSGAAGRTWSDGRRFAFANDLENLVATNDTANRCKSDKGPAEWDEPPVIGGTRVCDRQRAPKDPQMRHSYACSYIATKIRWGLTVTAQDRDELAGMLLPATPCP